MLPLVLGIWLGVAVAIGCVLHGLCDLLGSQDELCDAGDRPSAPGYDPRDDAPVPA